MAGFCWWIKLEAFYAIIAILVIYLVVHRNQKNTLRNFIPFLLILLLVISPIFIQRDLQFDDPFYFWYNDTILLDNYTELLSNPKMNDEAGTIPEIQSQGILEKIPNGILNLFTGISRISFPYLFLLIPFGILFSLRPIDQKISRIKSTWALILTIIGVLIIPFSIIDERRFLFVLFPFLILLSTIPIQRVTEYGLSTFHLDDRKKTNFLIIVIMIILLLSITFTTGITGFGYGLPKTDFENEKLLFTQSFYENFDGRLLRDVDVTDYLAYVSLTNENTSLKDVQSPREKNPYPDLYEPGKVVWLSVSGNSIEQLILNGELRSLNYIAITEYGSYYYPFLNSLYENEEKYSFLEKIVDTNEIGFTHFKIKVFEIDYKKFHELNE